MIIVIKRNLCAYRHGGIVSAHVNSSLELRFYELIIILYTTANRVTMRGITKTVNYAIAHLTQTQASLRACQVQKGYKHRVFPIHFLSFFVLLFRTYQIHPASGRNTPTRSSFTMATALGSCSMHSSRINFSCSPIAGLQTRL